MRHDEGADPDFAEKTKLKRTFCCNEFKKASVFVVDSELGTLRNAVGFRSFRVGTCWIHRLCLERIALKWVELGVKTMNLCVIVHGDKHAYIKYSFSYNPVSYTKSTCVLSIYSHSYGDPLYTNTLKIHSLIERDSNSSPCKVLNIILLNDHSYPYCCGS
ncbi:unnamed protein product [Ceratitis capitata]|uniref:(Mediterranean fruit fly) hypothetical protein n=1 Tax=Ceratitis capitata TaxID=7213 RepID=A0A811UA22_CERCA|nr:unnamed protein product [Ceratitis capitata]